MPREERTQLPPRKREKPSNNNSNRDREQHRDGNASQSNTAKNNAKDGHGQNKTRHQGGRRVKRYNPVDEDDAPN